MQEFGIGSPLNPMTAQSANHKAGLAKAEREQKLQEASRMLLNSQVSTSDPLNSLEHYLALMADPKAFAHKVAEVKALKADAEKARKETEKARHDLGNLQQQMAAERRTHDQNIAKSKDAHATWLTQTRQEVESEKKAAEKLRAQAESDAAAAGKARAAAERKLRAFESA